MVINISKYLAEKGHEVRIFLLHNEINYPTENLPIEVVKVSVELSLLKKSKIDVSQLQKKIDDFAPDVVHSHLFESEIALAHIQFPKTMIRVVHFHDNMVQMKKASLQLLTSKRAITNFYERAIVLRNLRKTNSHFIAISNHSHNYVQKNLGPRFNIRLLLNAIDLQTFTLSNQETKKDSFSCAMVGSLVEVKGQSLALQTLFELKQRNEKIHLFLVGDGVMRPHLEQLTKQLDIVDQVTFTGSIDQPEYILHHCSLYVHTAIIEPFGLVIIEAMACGLPVICSDGLGNRDLIREGENGFLVKERNPKLLADKIQFLLERPHEIERMGKEAHRFAQNFGMENYIEKLIAVYNEATKSAKSE